MNVIYISSELLLKPNVRLKLSRWWPGWSLIYESMMEYVLGLFISYIQLNLLYIRKLSLLSSLQLYTHIKHFHLIVKLPGHSQLGTLRPSLSPGTLLPFYSHMMPKVIPFCTSPNERNLSIQNLPECVKFNEANTSRLLLIMEIKQFFQWLFKIA